MGYISLKSDGKAEILRYLRKGWGAFQELYERVEANRLTEDARDIYLTSCEAATADAGELLGFQAAEYRSRALDDAYAYIEQLEQQLTDTDIHKVLAEKLRFLTAHIKDWWKQGGFSHVPKIEFTQYGHCEVTFQCALEKHRRRTQEEDTLYQQWKESLPYDTIQEIGRDAPVILDTEKNRTLFTNLLKKRFPSIRIIRWDTEFQEIGKYLKLKAIYCMIYELGEI